MSFRTYRLSGSLVILVSLLTVWNCHAYIRTTCLTNLTNVGLFANYSVGYCEVDGFRFNESLLFDGANTDTDLGIGAFKSNSSGVDNVEDFDQKNERFIIPTLFDSNTRIGYDKTGPGMEIGISGIADLGGPISDGEKGLNVLNDRIFSTPLIAKSGNSATNYSGLDPYIVAGAGDVDQLITQMKPYGVSSIFIDVSTLGTNSDKASFLDAARTIANLNKIKVVALAVRDTDVAIAANARVDLISEMPTEALSNSTVASLYTNGVHVATVLNAGSSSEKNAKKSNFISLIDANVSVVFGTGYGSLINSQDVSVESATLSEIALVQDALNSTTKCGGYAFYEITTLAPAQLWDEVLSGPFYTGGDPEVGGSASFYAISNLTAFVDNGWKELFNSDAIYVKGNLQECTKEFCAQCVLGYEEKPVNEDVQIIVAVVVPTMFVSILYLAITGGVIYHFVVRNNALQVPSRHQFMELRHVQRPDDVPKTLL